MKKIFYYFLFTVFYIFPIPPQSLQELSKHANQLFLAENYGEAIAFYKQALALNPINAHLFFNLGQSLFNAHHYPEALFAYKKTIHYHSNHYRAFIQIGKIMIAVKQPNDAIEPLKKALTIEPKNNEVRILLSHLYVDKHQFNNAINVIEKGLSMDPNDINLLFELANVYNLINRLEESLTIYQSLDKRVPNNPSILYNIAFTLKKMEQLSESIMYYDRVLAINPEHTEAIFSRGLAYLVLGDFEKGFHGYEWRYSRPSQGSLRTYNVPRWDGSDLKEKTILLHAEQGLGDTFQFIRYTKVIREKHPHAIIIVAVQKPLVTFIKLCKHIDQVICVDETPPPFDIHAPLMSLPHILGTRLETVPAEIPYLHADASLVEEWKQKLAKDTNFKIGICWQGNDNYATPLLRTTVAQKSMHPKEFAPICAIEGVSVYSLQKTTGTDQLKDLPETMHIITFDGDFDQSHGRFMDTAAVIKNLNLIITVDTSISHLASALGTPTWVLLPNPSDWRWMMNRTDSPWYPGVLRLFKQPTPGDWQTMILQVAQELKQHIERKLI